MAEKRKISIGILRPEELELDTIYVNIKRDGGVISAVAVSDKDFKYKNETVKKADNIEGYSRRSGEPGYSSYWDFIKRLEQENNAVSDKERLFNDALDAYSLLETIAQDSHSRLKFHPYQLK